MNENKKIHEFALKYLNLYQNPAQAKSFESFVEKFSSRAADKVEEFEKISNQITDAKFLGTAIFSKWRYITHWLEEFPFENKFRKWFISAFKRLAEITSEKNFGGCDVKNKIPFESKEKSKPLVRIIYALNPNSDMSYIVDRTTGKQTRIKNIDAYKMIYNEECELWLDDRPKIKSKNLTPPTVAHQI